MSGFNQNLTIFQGGQIVTTVRCNEPITFQVTFDEPIPAGTQVRIAGFAGELIPFCQAPATAGSTTFQCTSELELAGDPDSSAGFGVFVVLESQNGQIVYSSRIHPAALTCGNPALSINVSNNVRCCESITASLTGLTTDNYGQTVTYMANGLPVLGGPVLIDESNPTGSQQLPPICNSGSLFLQATVTDTGNIDRGSAGTVITIPGSTACQAFQPDLGESVACVGVSSTIDSGFLMGLSGMLTVVTSFGDAPCQTQVVDGELDDPSCLTFVPTASEPFVGLQPVFIVLNTEAGDVLISTNALVLFPEGECPPPPPPQPIRLITPDDYSCGDDLTLYLSGLTSVNRGDIVTYFLDGREVGQSVSTLTNRTALVSVDGPTTSGSYRITAEIGGTVVASTTFVVSDCPIPPTPIPPTPIPPTLVLPRSYACLRPLPLSISGLSTGDTVQYLIEGIPYGTVQVTTENPTASLSATPIGNQGTFQVTATVNDLLLEPSTLMVTASGSCRNFDPTIVQGAKVCPGQQLEITTGVSSDATGSFTTWINGESICTVSVQIDSPSTCNSIAPATIGTYRVVSQFLDESDRFSLISVGVLLVIDGMACTGGDPHIVCLDGSRLDVYEAGYYRLFDNLSESTQAPVIINAEIVRDPKSHEDVYHRIWIKLAEQEYYLIFQEGGIRIRSTFLRRGCYVEHGIRTEWSYDYVSQTGQSYKFLAEASQSTVALKVGTPGESYRFRGLFAGEIIPLDKFEDIQVVHGTAKLLTIHSYEKNALLCGSAKPHIVTFNRQNRTLRPGLVRILETDLLTLDAILNAKGLLDQAVLRVSGRATQVWKWQGLNHWERTCTQNGRKLGAVQVDERVLPGGILLRVQGNGSISCAVRDSGVVIAGLLVGDDVQVRVGTGSLYERLIEPV